MRALLLRLRASSSGERAWIGPVAEPVVLKSNSLRRGGDIGLGARGALTQQVISDIKLPDSQLARAATFHSRHRERLSVSALHARVFLGRPGREAEGADL